MVGKAVVVAVAVRLTRAVRLARMSRWLVSVADTWSVAVDDGTSLMVGEAVWVAVAVRLTRAVRLARMSGWLVSVETAISSVAVGLGTAVSVAAAV